MFKHLNILFKMNNYNTEKCHFKDLEPYNQSEKFQEICKAKFINMCMWLLLTPFIYLLVLLIEKKYYKPKYKK